MSPRMFMSFPHEEPGARAHRFCRDLCGLKWDEKENRIRHVFVLNLILSLSEQTGTYVNVSTTKYYTT